MDRSVTHISEPIKSKLYHDCSVCVSTRVEHELHNETMPELWVEN